MNGSSDFVTLTAGHTSLVLSCAVGTRPSILYWGEKLVQSDPALLERMMTRQHAPGSADAEVKGSLLNETGSGVSGFPGFSAHRNGTAWASVFRVKQVRRPEERRVEIVCEDETTKVRATHLIYLDPASSLITIQTEIENFGIDDLAIDWCASASMPLDPRVTRLFGFTGRWSGEFQREEIAPFLGSYVRDNKTGRTSHDNFPGLVIGAAETHEQAGPCFAFHLGWSGNNRVRVDRLSDGRAFVQMGEYFFPGEMSLAPGETYRTPRLYAGFSNQGFSALSRQFHIHLKNAVMDSRIQRKPRPVHYNTWEAVYFDHDAEKLFKLAEKAAEVGAERYILDDGWFGSRRNDKAGLGDWWPSEDVYPDGLGPLIKHVTSLGMEFGLWFEPEMVNPDSDLFRKHPDWILQAEGVEQVPFRGQYVLDLSRGEVNEYLYDRLNSLLVDNDISYIKWDMNRDVHHPGSRGRAAISRQTRALYALIDRVRAAHPDLEIESCSSGGGRADYGILQRTDRIWTSDSNDALDRQIIQRGASHFFPLETMGAHVGPETCHITGRRLKMEMRVATALFGHMGMELNLLEESDGNLDILKAGIALHKQHRALIHGGDYYRLDTPEHVNSMGVVAPDQSEAMFSWCNMTGHRETLPGRIYVPGLDRSKSYRSKIVWPNKVRSISRPSVLEALRLNEEGTVLPGEALMQVGLQVPLLHPETCLIYHFEAI
ncbi:MAG: alpha-galactosidase [Hyphomonas sp.]|nr:alpha-galactosidase [Hyphomonas sp.]